VIIVLLILAPILVKMVNEPLDKFGTAINGSNPTAGNSVIEIKGKFLGLLDTVIVLLFLLNAILLLVSAFLIDTHPAFMIMYILLAFFMIAFLPNIVSAVDMVYGAYSAEVGLYLPFSEWMVGHFEGIIFGMIILSGIILYAKIKYANNGY